ncbi:siroheme synthase [Alcanivorax sp. S71-1-4]|uniref:uroporphyrinogen-III C-methyltransferase n=1 Tax=Alcanivorax sp. S71-1-4 TaxID=1177159 RepID=UPI0013572D7B|nr:uroporphyrinogen-III C-methyltransferase [Alcanivorax sp. S71-1-4]KAF0809195.1 siroheme synthase [Alcanivorax sp. S71-1-4]
MLSLFAPWDRGTDVSRPRWFARWRSAAGPGHVWLVGAGPGDPELITVRALRLLQQADVVVYDRLVAPALLAHCRRGARRLYVGKRSGAHSVPQQDINALLVREAQAGRCVVRLKGGDPFVFGRGGEEMLALQAAGVPVSVVPGISAAHGCAAATGIPLTHRDLADGVTFITAHRRDGAAGTDWAALAAQPSRTLVCYMGLSELARISEQLIAHGLPASTPAALICHGTTAAQRAVRCRLDTLDETAQRAAMASPCLLIIGQVVALGDPARLCAIEQMATA